MPERKRTKAPGGRPDIAKAEEAVRALLAALGLDPASPPLAGTPHATARAFADVLLSGYATTPREALGRGFPVSGQGPVIATRMPLLFVCPHHLMPAQGEVHVGFIPKNRVPGLARLGRLIDALGHRLVLQEDLTLGIVGALKASFDVRAAVAIVEARHGCVAIEDFSRRDTTFRTRAALGPAKAAASLEREIDATLRLTWMSASEPSSPPLDSRSPSRPPRRSARTPKKRTV